MLGFFLAMDGNNETQITYMRIVADEWYEKVMVDHLTIFNTWTAFDTSIMKTLEYPLLALTLTDTDCMTIMAPVLKAGLPNMGIC